MRRSLAVLFSAFSFGVACDDPGGTSGVAPGDVRADTADTADTASDAVDTSATDTAPDALDTALDTTPDTTPDTRDTTPDDTTASTCALGCIPVSTATAPTGVLFKQFASGPAPTLRGGAAPTGDWVLRAVDIHPNQTFADGIEVTLANHGATAGRASFGGDAAAMALDLDLEVTVSAFGSTGTDSARRLVAVGGCHAVSGARLTGQLSTCAQGFPAGSAVPSSLDFELAAGKLSLGLLLTRETIISLLPVDQQEAADFAVTGSLYLIAKFEKP